MARRFYSSVAASTTLSSGITNSATSITVGSVSGFPGSYPYTLIIDPDTASEEVVTVTAGAGTTLTVTRGVDGSAGVAHNAAAVVRHGVSARDFDEPNAHVNTGTGVHGLTGAVVGDVDTQTLTNKTITGGTLSGTIAGSPTFSGNPLVTGQMRVYDTNFYLYQLATNPMIVWDGNDWIDYDRTGNQWRFWVGAAQVASLPSSSSGTIVTTGGTHTLTGKTLNGATLDAASTVGGVSGTTLAAKETAWTSYTPTFTNVTGGAGSFFYKFLGAKTLAIRAYFSAGTVTATGPVYLSLPSVTGIAGVFQPVACVSASGALYAGVSAGDTRIGLQSQTLGQSLVGYAANGLVEVQ